MELRPRLTYVAFIWRQHAWRKQQRERARGTHAPAVLHPCLRAPLSHNYEPGDHLFVVQTHQLLTMKFSMLAIAATAFAGVQGFAPVANPSTRVLAMQVRRLDPAPFADSHRMA